jgi:hypothetical protein
MRYLDDKDDEQDRICEDQETVRCPIVCMDSTTGRTVAGLDYQQAYANYTKRASEGVDLSGHRPGYVQLTDEQIAMRRTARDAAIETARQAWKGDARRRKKPDNGDDDDDDDDYEVMGAEGAQRTEPERIGRSSLSVRSDDADRKRAAYETYCAKLRDSWKSRPMDAGEPSNSSSPAEWNAHRRDVEPDHDAGRVLRGHLQTERNEENQRRRDLAWNDYKTRLAGAWQRGRTDPRAATEIEQQREKWLGK